MTATPPPKIGFVAGLKRLLDAASPRRRLQLGVTLALTLAGAIAELVTIGAVLPVLAVAAQPDSLPNLPVIGPLLSALATRLDVGPVIAAALFLVVAAIGATAIRLMLTWASQKFTYGLQQDLTMEIFGRALRQPYSWYLKQNSSVLISSQNKVGVVIGIIVTPLLQGFTSAVMASFMIVFLFALDPKAALIAAVSVGGTYLGITLFARPRMERMAIGLSSVYEARVRTMQETLGGIRDINLDQSQAVFEERLRRIEDGFRRVASASNLLASAPRLLIEGIAIILVAVLAAWFSLQPGGVIGAIPVLGALALGAQRMLPMIQLIYIGWANYSVYSGTLFDIIALLDAPVERMESMPHDQVQPFRDSIAFEDVRFSYNAGRDVLSDIVLAIRKGERIGFIGKTGSGKSTLVDVLMGLLPPSAGRLLVDGQPITPANIANWKAQIAHVPQVIFLADDSIAANIAFGHPRESVDLARVERAAREAGLGEFLDQLPEGMETTVGERGIRLSGGQRQRIGIARALYKHATVLVLDEATSALDDETEAAVMSAVAGLDQQLTIIIIAHRLSTVASCDRIYRLSAGRIVDQGSYVKVTGKADAGGVKGSAA